MTSRESAAEREAFSRARGLRYARASFLRSVAGRLRLAAELLECEWNNEASREEIVEQIVNDAAYNLTVVLPQKISRSH